MEIKTHKTAETTVGTKEEEEEQPLSPTSRLFHAPKFDCYIMAVIGVNNKIKPDVFIDGLEQTLIKHPRFSSKLMNENEREQKWVRTKVVAKDHIIIPKIEKDIANADAFLESYVSDLTTIPLDTSKPLWELHLLDLKTSDAENVVVLKTHHSMGDGTSLMSLVLACTRKTSNHDEIPSLPSQNRPSSGSKAGSSGDSPFLRLVMALWSMIMFVWNTVSDTLKCSATLLFLKDTETPIKGDFRLSERKRMCLVHRTVSFDDIKIIKNTMKMTVNDVLLGVSQAGLSKYLARRYGEEKKKKAGEQVVAKLGSSNMPKGIRLRACVLVNIRPTSGVQDLANMMAKGSKCKWGNWIGYIILPFSLAIRDDPLEHLRKAKSIIDQKKNSFFASLSFATTTILLKSLGLVRAANLIKRALSNTTMSFSNLVGPTEEVSLYGHPITYIAPSAFGHPHALTMHYQSYMNKMTISLTVDPKVISDPHRLLDDLEESLKSIKAAVQERGSTQ